MDEFFQKLREIQKKERNLSGLAPVGENFYQNISNYFNVLMKKIDDNPFSFESYLLRDAQRITAEICERREHKISNSAVMSVQRAYKLFKESEPDSFNTPKIPRNSTPEEEELFQDLINSLISYREKMRGPLRFHTSDTKNKGSNISEDNPTIRYEDNFIKKEIHETKSSKNKPQATTESSSPIIEDKNDDMGFSPEEEAAIEDDIYKQFGEEPFPGNTPREKSQIKTSDNIKTGNSKIPREENNEVTNNDIKTDVLLILDELPSIMGADNKVYGPFSPQDIITIPEPTAKIIIKNQKGKSIQKYK